MILAMKAKLEKTYEWESPLQKQQPMPVGAYERSNEHNMHMDNHLKIMLVNHFIHLACYQYHHILDHEYFEYQDNVETKYKIFIS